MQNCHLFPRTFPSTCKSRVPRVSQHTRTVFCVSSCSATTSRNNTTSKRRRASARCARSLTRRLPRGSHGAALPPWWLWTKRMRYKKLRTFTNKLGNFWIFTRFSSSRSCRKASTICDGTATRPRKQPPYPSPPRCAEAGCTSKGARCGTARPS